MNRDLRDALIDVLIMVTGIMLGIAICLAGH